MQFSKMRLLVATTALAVFSSVAVAQNMPMVGGAPMDLEHVWVVAPPRGEQAFMSRAGLRRPRHPPVPPRSRQMVPGHP